MRDFLDAILAFINSASLTDEEFDFEEIQDLDTPPSLTLEMYNALKLVLNTREEVSEQVDKLKNYFLAGGVSEVDSTGQDHPAASEIFLGAEL